MNSTLTMEVAEQSLRNARSLNGCMAFLATRSTGSAEVSAALEEVFKGTAGVRDQLLMNLIEKRTSAEFNAEFREAFPKYLGLMLSVSGIARAVVPPRILERLTKDSIQKLETDFRAKALLVFGAPARDQAMFTIWTLRKINTLVTKIVAKSLESEELKRQDDKICWNFNVSAIRAQCSLDCLNMALQLDRPIYPEVMVELIDGLRAMVNAYAWARQGAALRWPPVEAEFEPVEWDKEEENLLSASMLDMSRMSEAEDSF